MKGLLALVVLFTTSAAVAQQQLIKYVKPNVGTDRMGHTYPGATVPFGAVQLSPETDTIPYEDHGRYNKDVYKYCAGYQYQDKTIVGFSHTHFSGTGHSDLGDFLIMPTTGELKLNTGTAADPASGFRSGFTHATEVAEPDYYKVKLDRYNILAELTTTTRVGFHQYTFPASDKAHIILDAVYGIYNYPDKNVWTNIRVVNDTLITGYRQTTGWARTRTVYFAMILSKPITDYGFQNGDKKQVYKGFWGKFNQTHKFPEMAGRQIKAWFDFKTEEGEKLKIKFAISPVSTTNALQNLRTELPGWDFNETKSNGQKLWEKELSKIVVQGDNETKENFYTAMYHSFINPTVYMDVNREYRGLDQETHKAEGFTNYTTFSLWDTHRALHPLFNIIQPKRNADMINSMLAHYDQSPEHMLPIWSNSANENWCMTGIHALSVIADAVVKNVPGFDVKRAADASFRTAENFGYEGLGHFNMHGYVPEDQSSSSVSKTLEYAYDSWCMLQMANKIHNDGFAHLFASRSENFWNVHDATSGFMRPRLADQSFKKDFDVLNTDEPGFIEGNAWNYSLYVPHRPKELIQMNGGNKRFIAHLDSLFTMKLPDSYFANTEDITRDGIIGNYVHGNEPSHHVAYLYNYADAPWKTQEHVRMILKQMYHPTPSGLSGNDDCGQMSAWYIFSAMGFYPVAPGNDHYDLGSPCIESASLHLENGRTFTIKTQNQSTENVYVQKVTLNGQVLDRTYITHPEIMNGGELVYYMSDKITIPAEDIDH